jgi:60 kDa SS-A/Ro ribonucleoprotein
MNADKNLPGKLRNALQDAMETAIANVPKITGNIVVCPDVSGSMQSSITGYRQGASSKVRCIDVAALVAAAFLRKNREARVLPFEVRVVDITLNPRDSVMTNATTLAGVGGGGTNCSAPLAFLNKQNITPDLVVFISDNESWADPQARRGTSMMVEWEKIKTRNPKAKLVCIDMIPNTTTQAPDRKDILNIAGFSDKVFDLIASFGGLGLALHRSVGGDSDFHRAFHHHHEVFNGPAPCAPIAQRRAPAAGVHLALKPDRCA